MNQQCYNLLMVIQDNIYSGIGYLYQQWQPNDNLNHAKNGACLTPLMQYIIKTKI